MSLRKVINYTVKEYRRNLWLITILSVMFVVSLLSLFLVPTSTYVSLGGNFIRTTSIPQMSSSDIIIIAIAYLFSLFVFSDALTNINLIIKANRTVSKIPNEMVKGMFKYALKILFVYTIAILFLFAVNIATFDMPLHTVIFPLVSLIVFAAIFFVPPAVVIDDFDTFRAVEVSIKTFKRKWLLVVVWVLMGFISISLVEGILFAIVPYEFAKYIMIALNGLILIPLLTIFQTQLYMEKYALSP